jgi:hypothetical protein
MPENENRLPFSVTIHWPSQTTTEENQIRLGKILADITNLPLVVTLNSRDYGEDSITDTKNQETIVHLVSFVPKEKAKRIVTQALSSRGYIISLDFRAR